MLRLNRSMKELNPEEATPYRLKDFKKTKKRARKMNCSQEPSFPIHHDPYLLYLTPTANTPGASEQTKHRCSFFELLQSIPLLFGLPSLWV